MYFPDFQLKLPALIVNFSFVNAVLLQKGRPVEKMFEDVFSEVELAGTVLKKLASDPFGNRTSNLTLDRD